MKKIIYNILLIVLICTVFFSISRIGEVNIEYGNAQREYSKIKEEVKSQAGDKINFQKLVKINPDVIAWIKIPGTSIDYPIVQGKNNEEYLHKTFEGNINASGAIFLDANCKPDFSSDNNVIYGHHMKNGSMFAELLKFRNQQFVSKHNTIILYLPNKRIELRVISAYATAAKQIPINLQEKNSYLKEIMESSELKIKCKSIRQLYTFVTCSYEDQDFRTYVHATAIEKEEGQ